MGPTAIDLLLEAAAGARDGAASNVVFQPELITSLNRALILAADAFGVSLPHLDPGVVHLPNGVIAKRPSPAM